MHFETHTCPVCGKSFIPAALHIYKVKLPDYRVVPTCGYNCMLKYRNERERIKNDARAKTKKR